MVRGPPPDRGHSTSVPCGLSGTRRRPRGASNAIPSTPSAVPAEGSSNKVVRAGAEGGGVAAVHGLRAGSPAATPRLRVEGRLRDEPNFPADTRAAVAGLEGYERGARDLRALLDLDVQVAGARAEVHAETRGGGAGGRVFRHADPRREEAPFHASGTEGRDAVNAVRVRNRRRRAQRLHDVRRRQRQHQLPDADVGDGGLQRGGAPTDLGRVEPDLLYRQAEQREHLAYV